MVDYDFKNDVRLIRVCLDLTQTELASAVGLSRSNIARYEAGDILPRKDAMERIYNYAFLHGFDINSSKSLLYDDEKKRSMLLFYGAKGAITGKVDTKHSVPPNDFSDGFYLGQSLVQAGSWVALNKDASVYCFYFAPMEGFKALRFDVDARWMNAILYYRGAFEGYEIPSSVMDLVREIDDCDYLIAPIADNQMYDTLEMFRNNIISDVACLHALSANHLGLQYVLKSERACEKLSPIARLYLCEEERKRYASAKESLAEEGRNKTSLAIAKYRKEGSLFDELYTKKG